MRRLLLASLLLFPLATPTLSQEIPVNLKANTLKYEEERGVVTASGSVEVYFEELLIRADELEVDVKTLVATAEGQVVISRQDYEGHGEKITYYAETEVAKLTNFSTVLSPPEVKGKIYLKARQLQEDKLKKEGLDGQATTCDYEEPHYYLKASRVEYYPGDKIVGYNVTLYVNRLPVMWTAYYIISFKKQRVSLLMPVIGQNEVEGRFIKGTVDYFVDNGAWGSVYLDLMEKKGIGKGVKHFYELDKRNEGSLYFYHLYEADTGITDWVMELKHLLKLSKETQVSIGHNLTQIYLVPTGRLDQTASQISIDHASPKRRFNLSLAHLDNRITLLENYDFRVSHSLSDYHTEFLYSLIKGKSLPKWERLSERFTHSQPLFFENLTSGVTLNFYRSISREGDPADLRFEPQLDLTQKGAFYTLRLTESFYLDPDGGSYPADVNDEYLEKLPEMNLIFNPLDLKLLSLSPEIGFGRFHESKYLSTLGQCRHFMTNRYKLGLNVAKTIFLPLGSQLRLGAGVDQFTYDPGDSRYVLGDSIGLGTELGGFFRNNFDYRRSFSEGNSPFFFDSRGNDYHTLKDTITFYQGNIWQFLIDGGYNYQTQKYFDLVTVFDARPSDRLHLNLSSGYDIENKKYRDLVAIATLVPFLGLTTDLAGDYDLNQGQLKTASSVLDLEVGERWQEKWHFKIGHTYDFLTKQYIMRDLMVVKDLHCWEARFTYSDFRKEFRLSFLLKALPSEPVGFVTGSQGFLFEGFQQEAPRRY